MKKLFEMEMFTTQQSLKTTFLEEKKLARRDRESEKDRDKAARCIQKYFKLWLERKKFRIIILEKFDQYFCQNEIKTSLLSKPALDVYDIIDDFLSIYQVDRDKQRIEQLCRYFIESLQSDSPTYSYIGVALRKTHCVAWIKQITKFLLSCTKELRFFDLENPINYKSTILRLHTLVSFTSVKTWAIKMPGLEQLKTGMNQICSNIMGHLVKNEFYSIMQTLLIKGTCREIITIQPIMLTAITTLTMRPLILSEMSSTFISLFMVHILSVPGLVHHLEKQDQTQCIHLYTQYSLFTKCVELLDTEDHTEQLVLDSLSANDILYLLANLIHLANLESNTLPREIYQKFTTVTMHLLKYCQRYVVSKKSNTTYWHPILGWFENSVISYPQVIMDIVKDQLSYLWTGNILTQLICSPLNEFVSTYNSAEIKSSLLSKIVPESFALNRKKRPNNRIYYKTGSPEITMIAKVCFLYYTALCTMTEIRSAILTGLCYKDKKILYNLWLFLSMFGPQNGLKTFIDHIVANPSKATPELSMLLLFCDCLTHFITILDDVEMYEQQETFKLHDFMNISQFLNQLLYKLLIQNLIEADVSPKSQSSLFSSLHGLLMTIYRRDCQKKFCPEGHWLVKDLKVSHFLIDLDKKKKTAVTLFSKMPHIIPHSERVMLFRKYVAEEKSLLGLKDTNVNSSPYTLITIHRSRIVEDGYRQLAMLPPKALKGIIRVRFVNEQGVDEAGIDQDGVFKEFLEETIKKVFDPSLNLFKSTSENRLYPTPTSSIHENHLQLFEFVGRVLGKAIYEGIVVDVPFASFFVSQFCGQTGGAFYSSLDELASLDQDLYRSLTMVKHYDGDISDLELTFSLDENILGKLVTYELKPGGRALSVTNDNKINYIHLMARFKMYVQIKEQIKAFTKGFRSIINVDWLSLFSTPEWQRLISGDNVPLDLKDLRKNTHYYGGFHDNHRVISWLWDIIEKDFNEHEKSLFLKFVTSCSKSPLLGFSYLEPPFSIRCVEVGDDEDTGDTIGSVLRGFFTIHKKNPKNRLPTSSTCFNLLKLPNYSRKSVLREKLRYAISSNTGFELS